MVKTVLAILLIVVGAACSSASPPAASVPTPVSESTATPKADLSPLTADQAYPLLEANQCLACHVIGDRGNAVSGPSLNGLADRIDGYDTELSSIEYLRESLVEPGAYITTNCPTGACANVMPSYAGRLTETEIEQLSEFLLSLPSDTTD